MPTRVLMMVANDIRHDTRVLKTALALADGGLEVTILGYGSAGRREESRLGPVRILRVPVSWRLRDQRRRTETARRQRHLTFGPDPAQKRLIELRANVRAKEAAELGGRDRQVRARMAQVSKEVARVRHAVDWRVGKKELQWRADLADWISQQSFAASWRTILPEMDDYELAFAPVIDSMEWDIIHAHDVHVVGIASRAVARRRAKGKQARWVYDAHEFVAGLSLYPPRTKRKVAAYLDLEQEYVRTADAVVTVTEPLAEELQRRYELPATPTVVMNSPVLGEGTRQVEVGIRAACGLADEVPLLVYSGGVTHARGIDTAVEALPSLPGVHLAVVCVPHRKVMTANTLAARAEELGVGDRLHLLDPVRPDEVTSFVASADVGIIPLRHFGSHEFALANKLFEYLYAGLPCLVSDCKAQAEFVRQHDVGAVHVAADPQSFAEAATQVLARAGQIREGIRANPELLIPFAWERQEEALRGLYRRLLGDDAVLEPARSSTLEGLSEHPAHRDDRPSVIGIGPANMAGQAWAWAKAAEDNIPGVDTEVVVVNRGGPLQYPADEIVPPGTYRTSARWAQAFEARALDNWTHALLEAGRPLFGLRHGKDFVGDADVLTAVGIRVGLLLHGSEARDPARHATTSPWSPFGDPEEELTERLQRQRDALMPKIEQFQENGGPVFVSTPDLLDDVPGAILLPVVVDIQRWAPPSEHILEREVPVVLHAPSRASLKGTTLIEAAVEPLVQEGLIDFRHIEGVAPSEMPGFLHEADILIDQATLGIYGVAACEAMAAGRVVVSHVSQVVRERAAALAGEPLPIVQAAPDEMESVLRRLVADREQGRAAAQAGQRFVRTLHDGRYSASVLAEHFAVHG
ncbi:glycosyltransferase family 4 protein [Gephyromycinifex aptenodytis]|uniref:glycosyltransferase family 4 protein n=1 Tax=Gephyromycinifex aptenodytis TaxID=2716227 RepID=UPI001D02F82B|nr:glycosyltransferase family 4 protein [Gephyromycinifex aptenodytis]